jgi:hypothetical protein
LSSVSFDRAGLAVVEAWPTRYALFIVMDGNYSIVIEDQRIYWEGGGPGCRSNAADSDKVLLGVERAVASDAPSRSVEATRR